MTIGRRPLAVLSALLASSLVAAAPPGSGDVLEHGFKAHTTACYSIQQPSGLGYRVSHAACSPGGAWGPYLYVSLANNQDPVESAGFVDLLDASGQSAGSFSPGDDPGYFDFSSGAGPWGDAIWVDTFTTFPSSTPGFDSGFSSAGATCINMPGALAFDRGGDFGYTLYVKDASGIVRLPAPNACSGVPVPSPDFEPFSAAPAAPLAFGPGGAWGTSLYAAPGTVVLPDGSFSTFPFAFSRVTWADAGRRWAGDMFARLDGGDPGSIYRVKPNGTATLFATGFPGELTFCNGNLWIVANGACTRITSSGKGQGKGSAKNFVLRTGD